MDYTCILQNVKRHIDLDSDEATYFTSLLQEKILSRKEYVLKEGQMCTIINYVHQGSLRAFYRDREDNESIIMFAINDWWVTDMYSFTLEKPAVLNIDALEESIILQLQKSDLEQLYRRVPKFERFFRILMQHAYVREQLRIVENLSLPAEQRYNNFLKKYPQFVKRVTLKQIASYLGITPEFLSVIRKKESKQRIS